MVTDYPNPITSDGNSAVADVHQAQDGLGGRVLSRLRQTICGLHGHDMLMQFQKDRVFLECVSCGHRSSGWELTDTPRPVRLREEARPHTPIARPHLVQQRKIA